MAKKTIDMASKEILNTREAASLLKVTTQTIKNYIYSGKLKAIKTPGGHHRIRRFDLQSLGFVGETPPDTQTLSGEQLLQSYNRLLESFVTTIEALIKALDTRDIIASGHSSRVAALACAVGKKMQFGEKELQELRLAALLHDVGKIGISETILGKPGRLTDQEFFLVKKHPEIGQEIVSGVEHLKPISNTIRHHHERFDGSGYPDQLHGSDIELNARIIAVADAYDFLRSDLSFRKACTVSDAMQEIHRSSGSHFDPHVVDAFVDTLGTKSLQIH